MPPLISIITTSLNRRDLLRTAIESVLTEHYPAVEQVVVDGGSTDGTVELLREYEARFSRKRYRFIWRSEEDSGQGEAMNKGLALATGEYVMFLNSDDYLVPNSLSEFMDVLMREPLIDVLYGNHDNVYEDGRRVTIWHRLYSPRDLINGGYQIPQSATIFRRFLIERTGPLNERLQHVAEHDLFLRMIERGAQCAYLPAILQVTVEHAGRKTTAHTARAWRETKLVNFSHGGSYFSRFYVLYLKNVYFDWLFGALKKRFPRLHDGLKWVFNRFVRS